jgi:hypothetical protein
MISKSACIYEVDYSTVSGDRILPFVITLNTGTSLLYPGEGLNQTFCYDVVAVGQDDSRYADLSHLLLGICSGITKEDIAGITVFINGEEQKIVWGENVGIVTIDTPTGCSGLKFDFPLDKVEGQMQICISFYKAYGIGPVNICLFGGETTATGLAICGPSCDGEKACDSVFYQQETVCVPVKVTPFATPGTARTTCCGAATVSRESLCPGSQTSCSFVITQNLCIEIPVSFGATVETGAAVVQCGTVSETSCDCSDTSGVTETEAVRKTTETKNRNIFGR